MELSIAPLSNNIAQQAGFKYSSGVNNFADLTLRTREGDIVTLTSSKETAYSKSANETRFENGDIVKEFSAVAMAASQYSLSVEGDLNEEELAAIERLVERISPMAQSFFNGSDFGAEEISSSITKSMGIIDKVSLHLSQTIVKTASEQYYTKKGAGEAKGSIENLKEKLSELEQSSTIRDLGKLVKSVMDSVFVEAEKEFTKDDSFLNALENLTKSYNSNFLPLLEPLKQSTDKQHPGEIKTVKPSTGFDPTPKTDSSNKDAPYFKTLDPFMI